MQFELSPEVYDQIIFAMEDQSARAFVHRVTGQVVTEQRLECADEFIAAPSWQPADGFHLMEGFVSTVPNRLYREHLRDALGAGRGVFRSFKNALKQSRDLERSWYRYKEREMRRIVAEWYNQEREAVGLERLGPEPEETDDLTVSEFVVTTALSHHLAGAQEVDREAMMELGQLPSREVAAYRERRVVGLDAPGSHVVVASTPEEEVVGIAWARECEPASGGEWQLVQLAVLPYYRGLGLGGRMLQLLTEVARERGAVVLHAQLSGSTMGVRQILESAGYSVAALQLKLALPPASA